jgi:hypothetical protein
MPRLAPPLALVLLSAASAAVEAAPPALPGPAPGRPAGWDVAGENRACESCHAEEAAEWRGSLHHRAWDDGVFQSAYAIEPLAFCRKCHAPEADPARSPTEGARREGVGCVTCHVVAGEVVGARAVKAKAGGHAVRGDARMAQDGACASCHEFEFPKPQRALMQGTVDEHQASAHARESCQSCHMPLVRGAGGKPRRGHDFRVIGDPAMLRSAVTARAARGGEREIAVTLRAGKVGHDVPTGDMFRRLVVRARAVDAKGALEARPEVLSRRFTMARTPDGPLRLQVGDDRLEGDGAPRQITLRFAEPIATRAVRWEVVYQRMDPGMSTVFGVDPAKDEVVLAAGELAPALAR